MQARDMMAAAMGVLLLAACGQQTEKKEKAPTRVRTEVVAAQGVAQGRTYVGTIEEAEATAVSFTTMGTVRRMLVSEGQQVSRGQLIAEMDDTQARNLLATTEAQARQAEDALGRYRQLHEQGSMTDAQWVEVQSKVEQARSQLAMARKNLEDCRLTAPVAGVIGKKTVNAGETAMPSVAVATILDISTVKVKCAVPEAEMAAITATTPAVITVDALGRSFTGGRIEKGVQADALTHTYDVRVRVDNKERVLLPGMVATVRLGDGSPQADEAASPTLPLTAVQRRADGTLFVWTIDAGSTAHRTTVQLGTTMGDRVAIADGVKAGDRVVTDGWQKLSEGTKVVF